ncbi:MAG: hypothetical protein ACYS0C_02220 [Planctomycetota bacterium]|jgi:hypothetical protein
MEKTRGRSTSRKALVLVGVLLLVFASSGVLAVTGVETASAKESSELKPLASSYIDSLLSNEDTSYSWSLFAEDLGSEGLSDDDKDETGTDPRDFSSKFMPYYLYTELENNVKVNQLNLFGMYAFTPNFAMTFDWPVFKDLDYSSVFPGIPGGIGGGHPGSGSGAGFSPPFGDISRSGSTTGYGDLNLRFFYKRKEWGGDLKEEGKSWSWMPVIETTLPTASDDVLGGDTTIMSPGVTIVTDLPGEPPLGLGFLALMNFFDFDVDEGKSGSDVERFRGRWFWMQPLSRPGPNLGDGLYILTEFQPVYDFRTDDFDFWMGPEFGKIIKEGQIMYIKPGVGFDRDATDRKFTLEIGYRYFF